MLSFPLIQTGSADAAWAQTQAVRGLRDALDALDIVRASMYHLRADTEWRSDGVRALRTLLIELDHRATAEAPELHLRESELAGIDLS